MNRFTFIILSFLVWPLLGFRVGFDLGMEKARKSFLLWLQQNEDDDFDLDFWGDFWGDTFAEEEKLQ